jgi:hypothetical protein
MRWLVLAVGAADGTLTVSFLSSVGDLASTATVELGTPGTDGA